MPQFKYREHKSRDLLLVLECTGNIGCFDACVKNRIIFLFLGVLAEFTPNGVNLSGFSPTKRC